MSRLFYMIVFFNLIVSSPLFSQNVTLTAEEQSWLAENHTIRVYYWQHPPYFYLKDGKVVGISVDLLNAVSKNSGITFQFENRLYRFADVLQGLIDHEGPDLVAAIMPTPEREKVILFSEPYVNSPRFIFTRDDDIFISSIENLFDKNIAVVRDYVVHRDLVERFPNIDLLVFNNYEEALRAVSLGEATAFVGDLISTPAMINEFGLKNLKAACPSGLPDHPIAMGIRNDWPELRNIVNKALSNIPAAEKTAIINKWSSVKIDYGISPEDIIKWAFIFTLLALIIILVFLFINISLNKRLKKKTSKLAESEEKFKGVFNSMTDVFARADIDGKAVLLSPSVFDVTGYKVDELIGRKFADIFVNPEERELMEQKLMDSGGIQNFEFDIFKKDGSIITISSNAKLYFDSAGNPLGIESVVRDISERKKLEEDKNQSEQGYQALSEASFEAIFISEKGICTEQNLQAEKMFGYTLSEAVGRRGTEWIVPEGREMVIKKMLSGDAQAYETTALRKDGSTFPCEIQARMMHFKGREVRVTALNDITERKKAEEKLLLNEQALQKAQSLAKLGNWSWKIESDTVTWSKMLYNIVGLDPKEPPPTYEEHEQLMDKESWRKLTHAVERAIQFGEPYELNLNYFHKDGHIVIAFARGEAVKNETGQVVSLYGTLQDITERKQIEEALQESEEKYRLLFNSNPLLIAWVDSADRYKAINASYMAFFGIKSEEVVGKHISEVMGETLYARLKESINQAQKGRKVDYEVSTQRKNGEIHYLHGRLAPHINSEGVQNGFIVIVEDITERNKTEKALQESEQKFKILVTNTEEIIYMIAKDGTFLLSEGKGLEKFGLKGGDVVGKSVFELYKDFPEMLDKMKQAFNGETVIIEHEVGDIYFKSWYTPHYNQKGDIIGLLGLAVNITEQKKAELQVLEYQKRLKDLATQLTLAEEKVRKQIAGDLHDHVGQLLTSSRMQLSTINDNMDKAEVRKKIKNISTALLQANQATRKAIFNLSPPQLHEIGLYAAIHDWMKEQIEMKNGIKTTISGKKEKYKLDENTRLLIFRSIRELMINVTKHAKAAHLNIELKRKKDILEIVVQDDGVGFDYNSKLFKLKSDSYGLFSIQERISDLGGNMQIDSTPGKGTAIKLSVPLSE